MILIWRGWGILVPVIAIAAALLAMLLSMPLRGIGTDVATTVAFPIWGFVAAGGIWFAAKKIEGGEKRTLVDQATGRTFVVGRSAGSLFFIPTRYWAFIAIGLGILLAIISLTSPGALKV